jgi:hypothetical protein
MRECLSVELRVVADSDLLVRRYNDEGVAWRMERRCQEKSRTESVLKLS